MKLIRPKKSVEKIISNAVLSELNEKELLQSTDSVTSQGIYESAVKMQNLCKDDIVFLNSCLLGFGDDISYVLKFDNGDSNWRALLTKYAISQLGFRYGISLSYIQKCSLANLKGLVCENFNQWMGIDGGKVLVRRFFSKDGEYVRGILSTRYKKYDTSEIMRDIMDSPISDWKVKQYLLSPARFHLRLVSEEKLDVAGEDLFIGLSIDSSDVGRSSINLQFIIFRQVCNNGLILPYSVGSYFRQVHLGEGAERLPDRIMAKLNEAIDIKREAEYIINNVRGKELPFDLAKEEEVLKFRQTTGITKSFMDKVIELYIQRNYKGNERWDLINCMTEIAQGYDIDIRLQFERAAGNLLIAA